MVGREGARARGGEKKRGCVLSRLIIHFRQLATNYLPLSSICPSHDREANVWQSRRNVGSLRAASEVECGRRPIMKKSR